MAEEVKVVKTTEVTETKTIQPALNISPTPTTKTAVTLGTSTMALRGVLNPNGAETKYWFECSANPHFAPAATRATVQRSAGSGTHETHVEADISDLRPSTVYYFRLVAENQYGKVAGEANSFHTLYQEPKPAAPGNIPIATAPQHPPHGTPATPHKEPASVLTNALAIGGLIILIIIVLWGLLHLVSLSGGWFSSLFPASRNSSIQVTAPAQSYSGDPITLGWSYAPSSKGNYAFVYQCKTGLAFAAPSGTSFVQIPCGVAFTLGGATSSASLTPLLSGTTSVSSVLTVLYIPSATSTSPGAAAQGTATMAVSPAKVSVTPAPTKTPTTPTKKTSVPVYTSPADLAVSILSANVDPYGDAAVSFDITNVGGSPSGTYYFSAQLPTSPPYSYSSPAQVSLAPGSHIVSTLNFTNAISGTLTVQIGSSNDANAANNYASQYLNASAYNQYPGQNQPYNQTVPQNYNQSSSQCYYSASGAYVCNQQNQNTYNNGLPYYVNTGQYPYIVPGTY
jgi:hypothetical protein